MSGFIFGGPLGPNFELFYSFALICSNIASANIAMSSIAVSNTKIHNGSFCLYHYQILYLVLSSY